MTIFKFFLCWQVFVNDYLKSAYKTNFKIWMMTDFTTQVSIYHIYHHIEYTYITTYF